jgi:E3 ubiquitin-protein ligase BRE1
MEKERRKLQDEFDLKLIDSTRKIQEAKTESEALLNEMDKTGQAYEEMQEQNIRLIQQVRDKDKEYFSLFQERIKISNLQVNIYAQ